TESGALGVNEKYIVGYSLSENGVPVEYREDDTVQEYKPQTPVIKKSKTGYDLLSVPALCGTE
ncbi:hypothetical protein MKC66_21370, partial [[Clostridium] innocuum]|nr:hypothetical protein [[Clostridium] innocuum]